MLGRAARGGFRPIADIRVVTAKVSPSAILPAILMPAYSRVIPIAAATSVLAAISAGVLVMIFGLLANLEDRVREMPWTYWIMSIGLILMAPVLVVVATDRERKPRDCDQVAGVVMVLTVLAALRPLIVAFVGLEQPATLAERAPWIALSLINVAFGALLVAAAGLCARRIMAEKPSLHRH